MRGRFCDLVISTSDWGRHIDGDRDVLLNLQPREMDAEATDALDVAAVPRVDTTIQESNKDTTPNLCIHSRFSNDKWVKQPVRNVMDHQCRGIYQPAQLSRLACSLAQTKVLALRLTLTFELG